MIPQSQTLTLTLIVSFLASGDAAAAPSPSPSPSPAKNILSDPIGILRHPPPFSEIFRRYHPPPPPACPSGRIDCLETSGGGSPPAKNEVEKLNFGKKMGIVFAATAILLQFVLGSFLVYKRVQLKKLDQRGARLVSASGPS